MPLPFCFHSDNMPRPLDHVTVALKHREQKVESLKRTRSFKRTGSFRKKLVYIYIY